MIPDTTRLGRRLVVVLPLVVVPLVFSSCDKSPSPPTRTARNPEIRLSAAETWLVDGREVAIEGTSVMLFPGGKGMLVVKALLPDPSQLKDRILARAIARRAMEHGYGAKAKQALNSQQGVELGDRIGVALISKSRTPAASLAIGERFNFPIDELELEDGNVD